MTSYADLHKLDEDLRIDVIGKVVMTGKPVGIVLENTPEKIARYLGKVLERFPSIREVSRCVGPLPELVTIELGIKTH